jgi:hypothetical protein
MSLSEAAVYFKRFFKYVLLAIAGLAVAWLLVAVSLNFIPTFINGGVKPDYAFGVIPKPTIPMNITSRGISFVLDTVDGKLPTLPSILATYQTDPLLADILGPERGTQLASSFGFPEGPVVLDSQTYKYTNHQNPYQSMTVNIGTQNFILSSDYGSGMFSGPAPSNSSQDLIDRARRFLQSHNMLPKELETSTATVSYRKISGSGTVGADSIDSANFARVDLFRSNVNSYPIVGPMTDQALVYVGLKPFQQISAITELHYTFWPYFSDKKGLYPLLPVDQAFKNLQDGQASLISPESVNFKQVNVKSISIAYYQDDNYEPYLEPVYLFDGTGTAPDGSEVNARFYLPAVDPRYLK